MVINSPHHRHLLQKIRRYHHYPHDSQQGTIRKYYDIFIYGIAIVAPLTNIPQIINVRIHKDTSGVSALSWFMFAGISLSRVVYGIIHKDKHILLMNACLVCIQLAIAVGVLLY